LGPLVSGALDTDVTILPSFVSLAFVPCSFHVEYVAIVACKPVMEWGVVVGAQWYRRRR
jgi:hypothetical protein